MLQQLASLALLVALTACGGGGGNQAASDPAASPAAVLQVQALPSAIESSTNASPVAAKAVDLTDAIAILKMIVGLDVNTGGAALTAYQAYAADVDGNGRVELSDAISVLKRIVGLETATANWMFFNGTPTVADKLNPGLPPAVSAAVSYNTNVIMTAVLRGDVVSSSAFTYKWDLTTVPAGSTAKVTLANSTAANPSFKADLAGAYVATMTITDGSKNVASSSVTLTACSASSNSSNPFSGCTNTGTDLMVTGTAVTGLAIDSGTIQVKCQSGTGTTKTDKDGSFTVSITNGTRPCILKVTDPISASDMHSLLESGTVANISPVTDLIVANTTGLNPTIAFTNFSLTVQASINSTKVNQAITIAQKSTAALGTDADMTGIDPLKISIKARQGDTAGDATDKKIDALMAALAASDKKISELSELLKSATTSTVQASTKTLVGDAQYSLTNCPVARSGDVWSLDFEGSEPMPWNVNFSTSQMKDLTSNLSYAIQNVTEQGVAVSCAFKSTVTIKGVAVSMEFRISDGGVSGWKLTNPITGKSTFGIAVPKQSTRKPTSIEFGGTFPAIFFINIQGSTTRTAAALKYTIDSSGNIAAALCDTTNVASPTCTGSVPQSTKNFSCIDSPAGYLSCQSSDGLTKAKAVLYASPGQAMMLMSISQMPLLEGGAGYGLLVMNKAPSSDSLPKVGDISPSGWFASIDTSNSVKSGLAPISTVLKVDTPSSTYESTIPIYDGVFKTYTNNPSLGFRLQTYKTYKSIFIGSPTGWLLSAGKGTDSTNMDWTIGIRDKQ